MNEQDLEELPSSPVDVGEYCRRVEQHLTRVNGGHLVRIVGPGFELVRTWAVEGVPLGIVLYAISQKAERHHAGPSRRPLRLEFCEIDVRAAYEQWRRAVGLHAAAEVLPVGDTTAAVAASGRRPSLSKHLERAADRLGHAAGRLDLPELFRDRVGRMLETIGALREQARNARGPVRDEIVARLQPIDDELAAAARDALSPADLAAAETEAEAELAPFRARLPPEAWQRSIAVTVDRLVRDRLGLPVVAPWP